MTIYFDNAASTPMMPEVLHCMLEAMRDVYGNPSSEHAVGRAARGFLESSRTSIERLISVRGDARCRFANSGSEANSVALDCLGTRGASSGTDWLVLATEHASIMNWRPSAASSADVPRLIPVDSSGIIQLDVLRAELRAEPRNLAVQLANSETGVIQPLQLIGDLAMESGVLLHSDISQALGRMRLSQVTRACDSVAFGAHKCHGPKGVGALLFGDRCTLAKWHPSASHESGSRLGTESVPAVVGLAAALQIATERLDLAVRHLSSLRARFESSTVEMISGVSVNGSGAPRLPNATNLRFEGIDGQALVAQLDAAGIYCSQTSACTSGRPEPSYVLRAMGLTEEQAYASVRFSFSVLNTEEEVDYAVEKIVEIVRQLRNFRRKFVAGFDPGGG